MKQKTLVVMQPGYLPWLGFFELMNQSDVFVIYDNVQYDKNGWRNRNRIKTPNGAMWLTVPVKLPNGLQTKINEVEIDNSQNWRRKHLEAIRHNYRKASFFGNVFPVIESIIGNVEINFLADLNWSLIQAMAELLGLKRRIINASSLHVSEEINKVQRLILMCQLLECNRFYEAAGGKNYLADQAHRFSEAGIKLEFQAYKHPVYRQLFGEFVPHLSTLDLLMNEGLDSLACLKGGGL